MEKNRVPKQEKHKTSHQNLWITEENKITYLRCK